MSEEGGIASAVVDGFKVEVNTGATSEEITAALKPEEKPEPTDEGKSEEEKKSEAAAELGKAGGKATAEKRAAEAEEAGKKADAEAEGKDKPPDKKADIEPSKPEDKPKETKAEGQDTEGDKEEDKEKPLGKPRHDPKARMLEATRKESEAKRALAEERAEREGLQTRIAALERGEKPQPRPEPESHDPREPNSDDYEDPKKFLKAWGTWQRTLIREETEQREQAREGRQRFEEDHKNFCKHFAPIKDRLSAEVGKLEPSFMLAQGQTPTTENWIADVFWLRPEIAPPLALYLSEHPDEFQRIVALSNPHDVSRELTKLETRLEAATTGTPSSKPEEEVSKAAPPVTPVSGAPYVAESGEPDPSMGFDKWFSLKQKQRRAQR